MPRRSRDEPRPEEVCEFLSEFIREYGSWEALVRSIDQEDLPAAIKEAAVAAIPVLRRHLGTAFPAEAIRTSNPVASDWWSNQAPWTRQDLAIVAGELATVRPLRGSYRLIRRLRDSDQARGAMLEISLACRALDRDLRVELEPSTAGRRRTDLRASFPSGGPFVYIEITGIDALSRTQQLAESVFHRAVPPWKLRLGLAGGSRFLRLPAEGELAALYEQVDRFWEDADEEPAARDLIVPGLLVMWRCSEVDAIAREHYRSAGYPTRWEGPEVTNDPLSRIWLRVDDKVRQLPADRGSVVVCTPPPLSLLSRLSLETIADELSRMSAAYPQLNAVVLHHVAHPWQRPPDRATVLDGGHLFSLEGRDQMGVIETLVAWNRERGFLEADPIIRALFGGRMGQGT